MSDEEKPFRRTTIVDEKPLVGAKWWNRSLEAAAPADPSRRNLVIGVASASLLLMLSPICLCARCGGAGHADEDEEMKKSLEVQQNFGWNFGGEETALVFDGGAGQPFDPSSLSTLAAAVEPRSAYRADNRRTLFDAPDATPKLTRPATAPTFVALRYAMKPHVSPSMDVAYKRGKALASLFADNTLADFVFMIDLPGPDAVAFAAGLASLAEPVFTFENWPHPLGVVPAHQTLAAVVYYRPAFEAAAATPRKLAAYVLDRHRLVAYTDDGTKFDNRYVARVPTASFLAGQGVKHVLYVSPSKNEVQERDDLNDDFVAYERAGVDVRVIAADDFMPGTPPAAGPTPTPVPGGKTAPTVATNDDYYYGGSGDSHYSFWGVYGYRTTTRRYSMPAYPSPASRYRVTPRATPYAGASSGHTPAGFGSTRVYVSRGSRGVTAPAFGRSGSYGRSSGSWGS
jgi:hypothetical protein